VKKEYVIKVIKFLWFSAYVTVLTDFSLPYASLLCIGLRVRYILIFRTKRI